MARAGSAVFLILCSIGLAAAAAVELAAEASPYFVPGIAADYRVSGLASGQYRPAGSQSSRDLYFRDCLDLLDTALARLKPAAERRAALSNCQSEARAVAAEMPLYALPYVVEAATAAELGDFDAFGTALQRSIDLAPAVQWLAERRTRLAARHLDRLDAAGLLSYDQQLLSLLDSASGAEVLALRFVRQPPLRDRLTRLVDTAPRELQLRFLSAVKRAAAASRPQ